MKTHIAILFLSLIFNLKTSAQTHDTIYTIEGEQRIMVPAGERWEAVFDSLLDKPSIPFSAADFEGRPHSSTMYHGKVLILYFWNIWDWDVCEKQTAELNRLAAKYPDVAIVSFVREKTGMDEFAFLLEHKVKFPIIPDSEEFGWIYHGYLKGTPIVFFIDKEGICRNIGINEKKFEAWVEALRNP